MNSLAWLLVSRDEGSLAWTAVCDDAWLGFPMRALGLCSHAKQSQKNKKPRQVVSELVNSHPVALRITAIHR